MSRANRIDASTFLSNVRLASTSGLDDDSFSNLASASQHNIELHAQALQGYIAPNSRNKMFNSLFKIWKRKDLAPLAHNVKISEIFDVRVTCVESSACFYAQKASSIADLNYLEECSTNYANVLLNESDMQSDLWSYQRNIAQFDLVLVQGDNDLWKRAVYLGIDNTQSYHVFHLIDWGSREAVDVNHKELFVLPFNEKLVAWGPMALRCQINQSMLKVRETCVSNSEIEYMNKRRSERFNEMFKDIVLERKNFRIRIAQRSVMKSEFDFIVELFFMPDDAASMINELKNEHRLLAELINSMDERLDLSPTSENEMKLSCSNYILDRIRIEEKLNQVNSISCLLLPPKPDL